MMTFANSAREALQFIRAHYWERAGVDWDRLDREWDAAQNADEIRDAG